VDIVNLVNSYYDNQLFDPPILITLINQITFDDEDPWEADTPLGESACSDCGEGEVSVATLLNNFNAWRADTTNIGSHDNAQLFSSHDFSAYALGYASVSAMCTSNQP